MPVAAAIHNEREHLVQAARDKRKAQKMASTSIATEPTLEKLARRHLWMHFTRMSTYEHSEIPIIVRGDGCYVYDQHGRRYLDGLSALYCVNVGHGRAEIVQAGAEQARELGFYSTWSYAHPPAIELAARVAALAPGDLNRVFFTSGGSEAVESALKLARQYHKLTGKPNKTKVIAREIAYHGTSLGALSMTGITYMREPFEPLTPGVAHVPNTNTYRLGDGMDESYFSDAIRLPSFGLPGTIAGPVSPPFCQFGLLSSLSPPRSFLSFSASSEWHL